MIDIQLLEKTTQIPGAPGFEYRIRNFIQEQVTPLVDEVYSDAMGNLIALKKGTAARRQSLPPIWTRLVLWSPT